MLQQLSDWLVAELQRVEQKILAQHEKLRRATSKEDRADIKEEKDRLVQNKRDLQKQLADLQTELACPGGAGLLCYDDRRNDRRVAARLTLKALIAAVDCAVCNNLWHLASHL